MNLRLAYDWIGRHGLDADRSRTLFAAAGLRAEPPSVTQRFWPVVAVLAAALAGLGVILWVAANWQAMGRMGKFALLQAAVLVLCAGAVLRPALRAPLGLLAMLCIGGLFAFFGQTYQTGADPWQLFAVWAVISLPLCLGARSDVLWAPWALIVAVGISTWTQAHTGHRWRVEPQDLGAYAAAWMACAALVAILSPALSRATGAGPWAVRTAGSLAVVMVTLSALGGLFHSDVAPHFPLALVLLAAAAAALAQRRWFEVFLMSAVALGLNVLLVAGLSRWMFASRLRGDEILKLLAIGLIAAALLAASVSLISRLARMYGEARRD